MKILLTGANGLLGSAVQEHAPAEWRLVAHDKDGLDITDLDAIRNTLSAHSFDLLLNCAAYTAVDQAESDVDEAYLLNATAPGLLAQATAEAGIPLVHISTDFVFDGEKDEPYFETDPTAPLSVYGHTKRVGENAVRQHNPNHLIVRTAWLYGDRAPGFPHLLLRLAQRGSLRVVTDQTGSPTYAPHLVAGIAKAIQAEARGTLHLTGSGSTTRFDWAKLLMDVVGLTIPIEGATSKDFPTPAHRPTQSALQSSHSCGVVLPDWEEGLRLFAQRSPSANSTK